MYASTLGLHESHCLRLLLHLSSGLTIPTSRPAPPTSINQTTMTTPSTSLSSLARSKLSLSVSSKDTSSLHRWVLLKNSIVRALPLKSSVSPLPSTTASAPQHDDPSQYASTSNAEYPDEDEEDAFVFPADGVFVDACGEDTLEEAQWLDSLLETLGDEDEEDDDDDYSSVVDDSQLLSSLASPMSSSDDLSIQAYYLPPIYPPYHPPLVHPSYQFPLYSEEDDDPLPYQGQTADDLEVDDMSMPEAIEDTSDDESDGPQTPLGQSSLLYLPERRPRLLPPVGPLVYVGTDDSQFYPFDLDPLPFASPHQHAAHDETYSSNTTATYQEC